MSSFNKNNLTNCLSPYLQQHAEQPVHWQPWTAETLAFAKQQNKPILLSIGYSACHWCHKMAEESFSDTTTAQIMNQQFVNIKVDREERTDLDKLYQQAHFLLNQRSGGWPLTVFIEPKSLLPFFAGTYFPPEPHEGLASFQQILMTISDIFQHQYTDVLEMCVSIKQKLAPEQQPLPSSVSLDEQVRQFIADLNAHSDPEWGGLSGAPKFPQPMLYRTALKIILYRRPPESEQLYQHIMRAAQSMSRIGLFDHLAGGFFRYCTDHYWGVPHFEKMLSDNALLMALYADLATFNKEGSLAHVCQQTHQWLDNEMKSEHGLFYTSLSADSEQQEGRFYLFDKKEVEDLLDEQQWPMAKVAFGLEQAPNVGGRWHLHQWYSPESLAEKLQLPLKQVQWAMDPIKQTLLNYRNQRPKPERDAKVLTGWNALLATALFKSGQLLNDDSMIQSAHRIISQLENKAWSNNQLLGCIRENHAYQKAFLDDYAYLTEALINSLILEWNNERYQWLITLVEHMLSKFYRPESGFIYSDSRDTPLHPVYCNDDALPSSFSIALGVLAQTAKLTGNKKYSDIVERLLGISGSRVFESPLAHASLLETQLDQQHRTTVVVRASASELTQWQSLMQPALGLIHTLFFISKDIELSESLAKRFPYNSSAIAYVCSNAEQTQTLGSATEVIQLLKQ